MSSTKGAFLKQKLINMARWVTEELGQENLPADLIADITDRSELECTLIASQLQSNKSLATHRDWVRLGQSLGDERLPPWLQEVIVRVRKKETMHDKFWRYVELFIEVAAQ